MVREVCFITNWEHKMSKRQILGVAGLLSAAILPLNYNIIINHEQVEAYNIFSEEALDEAIERAETARDLAKANTSEVYPGIAEYLDTLINDAKTHDYENTDEVIAALDEASEAVPYLLGLNMTPTVQARENIETKTAELSNVNVGATAVEATPKAEVAQAVAQAEMKAEPANEENAVAAETEAEEVDSKKLQESETQPEVAELPKTGAAEEKKLGIASLLLAGAAVVVSTIAAAIAVIYAKRHQ